VEISICSPNRVHTCIEVHSSAHIGLLPVEFSINVVLGFYCTNVQVVSAVSVPSAEHSVVRDSGDNFKGQRGENT
jgi:hypothetical protein